MAENSIKAYNLWINTPGKKGQAHNDSKIRIVNLPPSKSITGWDISEYRNRWDLIENILKA